MSYNVLQLLFIIIVLYASIEKMCIIIQSAKNITSAKTRYTDCSIKWSTAIMQFN